MPPVTPAPAVSSAVSAAVVQSASINWDALWGIVLGLASILMAVLGLSKLAAAGKPGEIARLRTEIEQKDRDIETLRKQAEGLSREYNDLCEKYGETQPPAGTRKDK